MATPSEKQEKKINLKQLNERYVHRIGLVKQGNVAMKQGNAKDAIKFYNMYFKIMGDVKELTDMKYLSPELFKKQEELSELLLISHIYWDLCKIYDKVPALENEFRHALTKFIEFTSGFRYQVVNAEMMRKFIQKDLHSHKEEFREAYKKIYMASKKCFVATYCFGEEHPLTAFYRNLKISLSASPWGQAFIDFYYIVSPVLVSKADQSPFVRGFLLLICRPLLTALAKIITLYKK
jgi:hypothetical protein